MEYKIQDMEGIFEGQIIKNLGNSEYVIKIDDREQALRIISADSRGLEFILDNAFHKVKYLESGTAEMNLVVDGVPITVNMHPRMDKVVYKNSGGGGAAGAQLALKSQIPGKVVSVDVQEGDSVKKGDTVCTFESMKMQVGIKAHKDGLIKSIKIKKDGSVAKNDVILEIE